MKKSLLFLLFPFTISAQTKLGSDIYPEVANSQSGWHVSLSSDGKTVAVGAQPKDLNNGNFPSTRVYNYNGENWIQKGQTLEIPGSSNESMHTRTKVSLSGDGNTIAMGRPFFGPNLNLGLVKVFQYNGNSWVQKGADIIGAEENDYVGRDITLSDDGSILAVVTSESGNLDNLGYITIYKFNDSGWQQMGQKILGDFNGIKLTAMSGASVSLSNDGKIIAIGCPGSSDNQNSFSGLVKMYQYNETDWVQMGEDILNDHGTDFGTDVSLSGDGKIVAIGRISTEEPGSVKIYNFTNDQWLQKGQTINGDEIRDFFGNAVSLSSDGNILAVGAPATNAPQYQEGRVKTFHYSGTEWQQLGQKIDGTSSNDYLGYDVSLSDAGDFLAVGVPFYTNLNYYESGLTTVYGLPAIMASDTFVQTHFSVYPNPAYKSINIDLNNGLKLIKVNIYNTLGQLISESESSTTDVSNLSAGTYYIQAITNQGKATKTFIKK